MRAQFIQRSRETYDLIDFTIVGGTNSRSSTS